MRHVVGYPKDEKQGDPAGAEVKRCSTNKSFQPPLLHMGNENVGSV